MIRPTSTPYRVLSLLADYPGELRAEDVARHLWPPPRMTAPPTGSWDDRRAAFASLDAARRAHVEASTERASRVLGRLLKMGLVEPCEAPTLATWYVETEAKRGPVLALDFATLGHGVKVKPAHRAIVRELVAGAPPSSVREWLAGRQRRGAYSDLVRIGVVVAPTMRRVTKAGRDLVAEVRARGAA